MRRVNLAALGFLLLFAAPAFAQDPTVVDSDRYKVVFENDQVRVLRITYGPLEKSVMHEHPTSVSVILADGQIRMHMPDGTTEDFEESHGEAGWNEAVTHLPENLRDESFEVILVELKSPPEEGCM